jgi:hypothetical protein
MTRAPPSPVGRISRRALLAALPAAAALAPRVFAQQGVAAIPARTYTYFTLRVADVQRSVDFCQGLFGMPIQARQGEGSPAYRRRSPAPGAGPGRRGAAGD